MPGPAARASPGAEATAQPGDVHRTSRLRDLRVQKGEQMRVRRQPFPVHAAAAAASAACLQLQRGRLPGTRVTMTVHDLELRVSV